jgi:Protein of unknown function (DUF3300)
VNSSRGHENRQPAQPSGAGYRFADAHSASATNEEAAIMAHVLRFIMIALLCSVPLGAMAQSPQPATAPTQPLLKPAELDQLVAPIALHPDPLLAEMLMASTYPLEVVQADRWAQTNKALKGDALTAALAKQSWDDSVKSLVQVPAVLTMMSQQLEWTQKLGDAVLAQQPDVMDAIQRLRTLARDNGKLQTTKEQAVTVKTEADKQYVAIEPASPTEISVPYYEPSVVYGAWPYPDYAPYYFPGYYAGAALATGIAFATAVAVRHAVWGGCNWGGRYVSAYSNRSITNINVDRGRWQHNPDHRHGVRYGNAEVRQKFAKTDIQAGREARQDFRGKDGQRVLDPGRPGGGLGGAAVGGAIGGAIGGAVGGGIDRPGGGPGGGIDRPGAGGGGVAKQLPAGSPKGGGGPKAGQLPAQKAAQRPAQQPAQRPSQPRRDTAYSNVQPRAQTQSHANRGRQSVGGGGGAPRVSGGGGRGGGGAARGGGGRGGGGGRRSDVALKHDVVLIGHLDNGLGFYRFAYYGSEQAYVGVMAQEVQTVMPEAVARGRDGYLRVFYDKLGLKFQTYEQWIASGAQVPTAARVRY